MWIPKTITIGTIMRIMKNDETEELFNHEGIPVRFMGNTCKVIGRLNSFGEFITSPQFERINFVRTTKIVVKLQARDNPNMFIGDSWIMPRFCLHSDLEVCIAD